MIGLCLIFILESVSIPYCKSINLLGKIYKFRWNVRDIQKNKVSELQYNLLLYMVYIYFNNWCLLRIAIIKETVTHHLAYALNHSFCCIYKFFHTTVWWVSHGKLLNVWPTWTTGEIWLWIVEAGRWADVRHWLNMGGKGLAYSS